MDLFLFIPCVIVVFGFQFVYSARTPSKRIDARISGSSLANSKRQIQHMSTGVVIALLRIYIVPHGEATAILFASGILVFLLHLFRKVNQPFQALVKEHFGDLLRPDELAGKEVYPSHMYSQRWMRRSQRGEAAFTKDRAFVRVSRVVCSHVMREHRRKPGANARHEADRAIRSRPDVCWAKTNAQVKPATKTRFSNTLIPLIHTLTHRQVSRLRLLPLRHLPLLPLQRPRPRPSLPPPPLLRRPRRLLRRPSTRHRRSTQRPVRKRQVPLRHCRLRNRLRNRHALLP